MLLVIGSSLSCGSDKAPTEPNSLADIAGRITLISTTTAFAGSIRVESDPTDNAGSPKAVVSVDGVTQVFLLDGTRGGFRSLSVGDWVRVWFDGPVQETYPVRGVAGTVVIDSVGVSIHQTSGEHR